MRPAFASIQQAAGFAFLLLVLLTLPVLLTQSLLPPRGQIYSWSGWDTTGAHPYNHQQIFEEKGDIDIAFIGSSRMEFGIDTPQVQEKLSEMLGHPATVRTIAWGGAGFDQLYFVAKDLLEHRKVKMLVFYDEYRVDNVPNSMAPNYFRFADDAELLTGLPVRLKLAYYYAAILGMPKNLLALIRPAFPADMDPKKRNFIEKGFHTENIVEHLGSFASRLGFNPNPDLYDYGPFIPYTPETPAQPSDVVIYSPETKDQFQFPGPPLPAWQLQFARKFASLAQQHRVKLVLLHFPAASDVRSTVIQEREFWPDALQVDVAMVGIPTSLLFKGQTDDEKYELFTNEHHMNKNGQTYFTSLITPALLKIYADQTNH